MLSIKVLATLEKVQQDLAPLNNYLHRILNIELMLLSNYDHFISVS